MSVLSLAVVVASTGLLAQASPMGQVEGTGVVGSGFWAAPEDAEAVAEDYVLDLQDDTREEDVRSLARALGVDLIPNSVMAADNRVYRVPLSVVAFIKQKLKGDPRVEALEPNHLYRVTAFPDDPLYKSQWHLQMINMEKAWPKAQGKGAVVAVIDTGVSDGNGKLPRVPDLDGTAFVRGYNFVDDNEQPDDDHGHGTHVAGTIAQATHNKFGVAGVAPQAAIMPIKVLSKQGYGTTADIADGIRWAVKHGAHVINMSLGGGSYSEALAKAVKYAHDKGVVVVCAAGNTGRGTVQYPAAYPGALAVSALGPDGKKAWYSSFGKEIFIGGPGGDTRVDLNRDGIADGVLQDTIAPGDPTRHGFFPFQGTSMASPHVAGAAALLVARGVTNPDKVAEILAKTAQPRAEKDQYGAGVLDVAGAVQALESDQWVGGGLTMALLALVVLARRGRFQGEPARVGVGGTVLALWAGAGLFPLAWWLGDALPVSLLAAPLPEWERVVMGPSWGPTPVLASAAVPVLASLFLLGIWKVRGLLVGLSVGVAAWLLTAAWAGAVDVRFIPGRGLLDAGWLVVNAVACLGLARLMMRK